MREVPVGGTRDVPEAEVAGFRAELREQRTLGDVFDWLRRQSPSRSVTEILTQDEYTHDVVVEWTANRYLVFDAT